MHNEMSSLWF